MAWNPLPQSWITSLTDDDSALSIDIADIPELTAAEIDSATGDIRKFIYALCEKFWTKWASIATADRCARMGITKTSSVNTTTGLITSVYTFTFQTSVTAQDVADET